jgi:hypothetical protein
MTSELTTATQELIAHLATNSYPVNPAITAATLGRAATTWGELHTSGNLWDTRNREGDLVLGKFTYSTVAGLLPGTTLEQHMALDYFIRDTLGAFDDQYVVDRLDQVLTGRPINLMGYISGGTSEKGQVSIQLDPELMFQPDPAADRIYDAVSRCAYALVKSGLSIVKPVAFHAEINNKWGYSHSRKQEHDLLKSCGVPNDELPLYRAHVYLTMPQVLPLNEDLVTPEYQQHTLGYWAKI